MVCGMNLRTPLFASLAVVSALGGVAAAAIALPSGSTPEPAATAIPSATPEVRTQTVRRTIHVVRRDRAAATATASASPSGRDDRAVRRAGDDSGHHRGGDDSDHRNRGGDDSGHHGGRDDSGHRGRGHSGDDDSGHGRGRGRGRGGDDD
jgi:hypothetical protein